jgi:hypothetical protein
MATRTSQAVKSGDINAAVAAVVDTWTLPDTHVELRERVAMMQRRSFAQHAAAPAPPEARRPLVDYLEVIDEAPLASVWPVQPRAPSSRSASSTIRPSGPRT